MSRSHVVIFLFFFSIELFAATKIDVAANISGVALSPSNNTALFGAVNMGAWVNRSWSVGAEYFRNIGLSNDIGQIVVGTAKLRYLLSRSDWGKEMVYGVGATYQTYDLNFGNVPLLGANIFWNRPLGFLDQNLFPIWCGIDFSAFFSSPDKAFEIGNNYNLDAELRLEYSPKIYPLIGASFRRLEYKRTGSNLAFSVLTYFSLSLGLAYSY